MRDAAPLDVDLHGGRARLTLEAVKGSWGTTFPVALNRDIARVDDVLLGTDPAAGAPKIASVEGSYDQIWNILSDLGYGAFDVFGFDDSWAPIPERGTARLFLPDESGTPRIFSYDILFIECGSEEEVLLYPEYSALIREYVAGGGRIYVSDPAYDAIEVAFPEYIDFLGDDTEQNAARQGAEPQSGKLTVTVRDAGMAAWLANQDCGAGAGSCINTRDYTIEVRGLLSGWAVMLGAESGASVKVWAEADVETHGRVPLTVSFAHGGGHVLFTSYHNVLEQEAENAIPQRRVLQYLVFEL